MIITIKLLLAHFVGDFLLQPDTWVKDKEESKIKATSLYLHILVHIALMIVLVWSFDLLVTILLIGLSHYIIDLTKLYLQNDQNKRLLFICDQLLHLIIISIVSHSIGELDLNNFTSINNPNLWLLLLFVVLTSSVGSSLVKILISKWTPETEDQDEESLSQAGSYIGILERLFVFSFVIMGRVEAVGFLLAAKSVFRFGDLKDAKDRKLTEYILIGTLLSFGLAILLGINYLELIKLITY